MNKPHEKSKLKRKSGLLKNVFYYGGAPTSYSPSDFGVSDEQSNLIAKVRKQFTDRQFEAIIEAAAKATQPTIANSVAKLYAAMAIREMAGDHLKSYLYLCETLHLLHSLPEEDKSIEYCLRLEVNIGVQIAMVLHALSNDTYYPKMICKASAELAPDLKMGNWTSFLAWAELEIIEDERAKIPSEKTNAKVHKILMDLKANDPHLFLQESQMRSYLESSYHLSTYRQTPEYRILMSP